MAAREREDSSSADEFSDDAIWNDGEYFDLLQLTEDLSMERDWSCDGNYGTRQRHADSGDELDERLPLFYVRP